jgi:hypothetical protein
MIHGYAKVATMWEVRGSWHDTVSSMQYAEREKAYEAFDTIVRSDPAWLELFEIEVGAEPRRLRRYELPRMPKKGRR